jgi:hypothetical protein
MKYRELFRILRDADEETLDQDVTIETLDGEFFAAESKINRGDDVLDDGHLYFTSRPSGESANEPVTREVAEEDGFAVFNGGPHLEVEVPDGNFTITAKTSESKRVTFAFTPYRTDGAPQCVDVQFHDDSVNENGRPEFDAILFDQGAKVADTRSLKKVTIASILLHS